MILPVPEVESETRDLRDRLFGFPGVERRTGRECREAGDRCQSLGVGQWSEICSGQQAWRACSRSAPPPLRCTLLSLCPVQVCQGTCLCAPSPEGYGKGKVLYCYGEVRDLGLGQSLSKLNCLLSRTGSHAIILLVAGCG